MFRFDNWTLEVIGEPLVRQFDNKTRTVFVTGDIPAGWDWDMLVQVDEAMDILPLSVGEDGLYLVLTAQQLSISGWYKMQLRATQGEMVKHTNVIGRVYIPPSLSGDANWPEIPSEFTELEQRVKADADRAEEAADRAEAASGGGGGGGTAGKDGGYYTPEVSQPTADTMQMSFVASAEGMPSVEPVVVTLPAGADGKDGAQGAPGKDGADGYTPQRGVDYYTEADKAEMVADVVAALPVYNGEVESV